MYFRLYVKYLDNPDFYRDSILFLLDIQCKKAKITYISCNSRHFKEEKS